ncbi:MAG TPA: hypothetical protein VG187_03520 [Mycobacterium sp.]|nr:hypothetical protein [Mycobacterium sp.]
METVLGVSMAPSTVRMVLVEGEHADGVTVDEENFVVANDEDPATLSAPDQVVAAILGTREGANEAGYRLLSTGVTWTDQQQAADLRDALAARKVENVMLVSAFLAAAALAQSVGSATGYARAALLYIEPDSATLAVVDTTDGAITDVHRELLPDDDDQAVARLVGLVSAAEELEDSPEGLLVVGSGIDVPLIKPALEAATSLPLTLPERPDIALARGAALASASAPLFASSTAALAYALDPGTGSVSQHALAPGYLAVAEAAAGVEPGADALAYSAVADDSAAVYTQGGSDAYADVEEEEDFTTGMYPDFSAVAFGQPSRTPFLAAMSVMIIFVVGVVALVMSLAFSIRPSVSSRPSLAQNVVAPRHVAAPLPKAVVPAPPAPAPIPAPAPVAAPAPVHAAAPAPVPVRVPAPAPLLPAPAPPPLIPPILPRILAPPLLGPPESPWGGDHGGGGWGHGGGGWGHGFGGGHGGFGGGFGGHGRG